ncbi:MAG: hypothetical protein Q3964_05090 [Carnobacterium sp.]|nr:hypothetical protein [Carnobacterium sp.]
MFKKSIKRIAMLFTFLVLGNVVGMSVLTASVYATEETYEIAKLEERQLTREEDAKIDPYVELTPNGYVLNDNPYSEEINKLALKKIARANESLSLSGEMQTFDYSNKTVTTTSTSASMFSVGSTYIEFYWNFARVYLSAYIVNFLIYVLETWVSNVLITYKGADLIFNVFFGTDILSVRNGIWFDFNYFHAAIGGMAALAANDPSLFIISITAVGWQ